MQEFNEGHITEGLDRCNTIMLLIDELLVEHPAVLRVKSGEDLQTAFNIIMDIYQEIGGLSIENISVTAEFKELP